MTTEGCDRCKEGVWPPPRTEIVGGYTASLCNVCVNALELFMRDHTALRALNRVEDAISLLFARTCGDGCDRAEELAELREEERELRRVLYSVSEVWVTTQG